MIFIFLDNIKVNVVNFVIKGIFGVRLIIDIINFDLFVECVMLYVCGFFVVCDIFDVVKQICYQKKIFVKVVILEGYVIYKVGLMIGG